MLLDLSRRCLMLALVAAPPLGDSFGQAYFNVRKAVVRSAQIANELDRLQQKAWEDLTLEKQVPDSSLLALDPSLARAFLDAAAGAFSEVRPSARLAALREQGESAAFRQLSNSERLAVQQDVAGVGAGFASEVLRDWLIYCEALPDQESQRRFNEAFGERLLQRLEPPYAAFCGGDAAGSAAGDSSAETGLLEAGRLLAIFEAGGAVRGVRWQGLDLFAEDLANSFSLLLERSAWLDVSLRLQSGSCRFYPDPVGVSVSALLRRCSGLRTTHIEYYLDATYMPDSTAPPTQTLIEWSRAD
mmetsp:Transcript_11324/g.28683  ORF Transcript_11324/g.28683 Transcript_11324/m.28683 type:complete len:301 (+) Transcript_11324:36-938(+)